MNQPQWIKPIEAQPEVDFRTVDGVFIKALMFGKAGNVAAQHKHAYDHGHFVASGAIALYVEGELQGEYRAPTLIHIPAGKFHQLVALEEGTVGLCIHNLHGREDIAIDEVAILEG